MANEKLGGIEFTVGADDSGLKKLDQSMENTQQSSKETQRELDKVDKVIKDTGKSAETASKKVDKVDKSIDETGKSAVTTTKQVDGAEKAIKKAGDTSSKSAKQVETLDKSTVDAGSSMRNAIGIATALAASLGVIAAKSAQSAKEIQNMARLSGTSVEEFQRLAFGANEAGISAEKLGDIYKDVQDKVGDFLSTGGGELKDYFEQVAPLVGQTAEQFRGLSGPEALQLFQQGLEKANLSASEQIFYLESLANDAALLAPLLANNGKSFQDAATRANDLNVVLSQMEIEQLAEVSKEFSNLGTVISANTQKIVAENAEDIIDALRATGEAVATATRFLSENMDAIKSVATWLGAAAVAYGTYRAAVLLATAATRAFSIAVSATPIGLLVTATGLAAGALIDYTSKADDAANSTEALAGKISDLTDAQRENLKLDLTKQAVDMQLKLNEAIEEQARIEASQKGKRSDNTLLGGTGASAELLAATSNVDKLQKAYDKLIDTLVELDSKAPNLIEITSGAGQEKKIEIEAELKIDTKKAIPDLMDVSKFVDDEFSSVIQDNLTPELRKAMEIPPKEMKKGLESVPSDLAMSVGEALASQDYSSFTNILSSQAAGAIGTALTDAIGGTAGGVIGGLVGGAAGAVISQAISDYMADDLISLERQASQGTGTVLGSIDEKSQSIANSLDYMSEGLDDLIGVNTEGFKSIQELVDSIGGASNLIARDFDASGIATNLGLSSLGGITQDFGGIVDDFFGGLTGGLFENVFGSIGGALFGKSSVSDQGISLLGGTIAELIENDVTQAYQTVTKKSLFGSSRKENYRFAGDAIEQQFDLTLEAMRDAVRKSAESLGMLPSDIQANLDAFTIEAQKISIKDLSAEEVADELEAVFSSIFDNLASAVVPYVDDFQQAGEGAGETLSRLSTNLAVVDEMLSQLRLGDLQGTTQEVLNLSESVVDFFGSASGLATAFTGFVDEFATEERQLEILTDNLTKALGDQDAAILNSRDGVYDYIASLEQLDGDNVERIANILSLTDSIDEYFDLLEEVNESVADYTDLQIRLAEAQDNDVLATRLTRERELSEAVDDTARGLLNSIYAAEDLADATQAATDYEIALAQAVGDDARALALTRAQELADAESDLERERLLSIYSADDLASAQEALNEARDEEIDTLSSLISILNSAATSELDTIREDYDQQIEKSSDALSDLRDDLNAQIEAEQNRADNEVERLQNEQDALSDAVSNSKALINLLDNAMNTLGERSEDLQKTLFAQSFTDIQAAIDEARATGTLPDSQLIEGAISQLTTAGSGRYSSRADMERDALRARKLLSDLNELADDTLTESEQQIELLERQLTAAEDGSEATIEALKQQISDAEEQHENLVDRLDDQYDAQKEYYDDSIDILQGQLDAINGVNDSFGTFAEVLMEALKQLGTTVDATVDANKNQGVTNADIADYLAQFTADNYVSDSEAQAIYNKALEYGVSSSLVGDILNSQLTGGASVNVNEWLERSGLAQIGAGGSSSNAVSAINALSTTLSTKLDSIAASSETTSRVLNNAEAAGTGGLKVSS